MVNLSLTISNCLFFHGHAIDQGTGGMHFLVDTTRVVITIENTELVENEGHEASEIYFHSSNSHDSSLSILNSTITHTETPSLNGVSIWGCCTRVIFNNTRMRLTKQIGSGVIVEGNSINIMQSLIMDNCIIERSQSGIALLHVSGIAYLINNCTISNNLGNQSVIMIQQSNDINLEYLWKNYTQNNCGIISNCLISDNNMTGIVIFKSTQGLNFIGHNVIHNNRNTQGAGIVLMNYAHITVSGELLLYNNTADKHGGAILVIHPLFKSQQPYSYCTMNFYGASSSVIFSGNRAAQGGSDNYVWCYTDGLWCILR